MKFGSHIETETVQRLLDSSTGGHRPAEELLARGETFGRFRVEGVLGQGGMATVYRAWDPELEQIVALKVLSAARSRSPSQKRRFRREATLSARLRHPGVVRVLAYGEEAARPYLVLELLEGPTLSDRFLAGPTDPVDAALLIEELARVVDYLHAQGLMHRDLKPSNVIEEPGRGLCLLDLGLAQERGPSPASARLTVTGEVLGTPAFMAPEQARGDASRADHRADVHALGAMLFALTSGSLPYQGTTSELIQALISSAEPPRLRGVAPEAPLDLERVCSKAMAKDPRDRYSSAGELAADLGRYLAGQQVVAREPGWAGRLWRRARRRPRAALAGALALGLLPLLALGVDHLGHLRAIQQRGAQASALAEAAERAVARDAPGEADRLYLEALLVAKGAFLDRPGDAGLRATYLKIKRARARHAERRGQWALALELREHLLRLSGEPGDAQALEEARACAALAGALQPAEAHDLRAWEREDLQLRQPVQVLALEGGDELAIYRPAQSEHVVLHLRAPTRGSLAPRLRLTADALERLEREPLMSVRRGP
mgnify:CR=1 FL=1